MKNLKTLNRRKYKSMYRRAVWKHVQSKLKTGLDARMIVSSQDASACAKTVLSDRGVSGDTLKEEKPFAAKIIQREEEGVFRKLSKDFDAFDQAIGMGGKNEYPL